MKQLKYLNLFSLIVISCGQKYEMMNMMPEKMNVTKYIESEEFRPDYCEERLDRLIKVDPLILNESCESELQIKLQQWKDDYNGWLFKNGKDSIDFHVSDLFRKTKYQYSYFVFYDPINVYRSDLGIEMNGIKEFKLFIRLDNEGKIYSDYRERGWIINSCDSVNSINQSIY